MRLILLALLVYSTTAFSQDILVIKKSMNPKNVLHYKANVVDCKFKKNAVSAYWVMGEEGGEIEDLTATERPIYAPKLNYIKDQEVDYTIGAMERLGNRLTARTISVRLEKCLPKAYMEIEGQEILLNEIFVKVSGLMSVKYMTITGKKSDGSVFTHTIKN